MIGHQIYYPSTYLSDLFLYTFLSLYLFLAFSFFLSVFLSLIKDKRACSSKVIWNICCTKEIDWLISSLSLLFLSSSLPLFLRASWNKILVFVISQSIINFFHLPSMLRTGHQLNFLLNIFEGKNRFVLLLKLIICIELLWEKKVFFALRLNYMRKRMEKQNEKSTFFLFKTQSLFVHCVQYTIFGQYLVLISEKIVES